MLLPIGDDNRDRRITPIVNYILIALNIFVFIYYQRLGSDINFLFAYSTIPGEILTGNDFISDSKILTDPLTGESVELPGLQRTPIPVYLTLITSMFMHGGFAHIGGNMLYLFIFGDNLENAMGHRNYLIFYILCGILAGLCHVFSTVFFNQDPLIPSLGASGAISGVLGGYMLLFPTRSVHVWVFITIISLPAIISVGLWFVFQVVNGLGSLGGTESGGVAYAAHIGGFIAGLILVKMFTQRPQPLPHRTRRAFW